MPWPDRKLSTKNGKRYWSTILFLSIVLIIGAACAKKSSTIQAPAESEQALTTEPVDEQAGTSEGSAVSPNDADGQSNASSNTNRDRNANTSSQPQQIGALSVTEPAADAELTSPFRIAGSSQATKVYVRVKSSGGKEIFTVPVTVRGASFDGNIEFEFTNTARGSIEVFEKDENDEEQNLVTIPVMFVLTEASEETVTNSNTNSNTNVNNNQNTNTAPEETLPPSY